MNTDLLNEIRRSFAANIGGRYELQNLPQDAKAYTISLRGEYGVIIAYNSEEDIYEDASNICISTKSLSFGGIVNRYLALTCFEPALREKFADLCYHFVDPGANNEDRGKLLSKPLEWWKYWTEMLGDSNSKKSSYDVLAELIALDYLYKGDPTIQWTDYGTHDIESATNSYEVKSTVKKSESHITISSRQQLECANQLELLFFRLEKSQSGFSINNVAKSLEKHGYDRNLLEKQLKKRGLIRGMSVRETKFTILEVRKFLIDDNFPKIVEKSFKNDVYPPNIIKIEYTIDLEGIDYKSIFFSLNPDGTISGKEAANTINNITQINNKDTTGETKYPKYDEWREGCIPLFSLRAACGYFDDGKLPEVESWIDITGSGITPNKDLYFVVKAQGDSMLNKIKDGDRCIFKWYKGGTRNNEIVLTQVKGTDPDYDAGYTIKKYHREENKSGKTITLLPLNENYKEIVIDDESYKTIGIFEYNLDQ